MAQFLLALDQATQTTGYAVFCGRELLAHGHVTFKDSDYVVRIVKLREWLKNLINSVDGDLEVVLEDIQLQTGATGLQTYKKLAHVQGALMTLLSEMNIPYQLVLASSWKSTCGIKGRNREQQKANAQKYIEDKYSFHPTQDEADAICIGEHAILHDWS